ncbi:MAG: transposase zinc-binding domain-containing protein [Desulfofustis sp. PB-SRB1]|nr:transposase zinc-binding domain-containing protein [Desulfofustis sp. PB-SRB1]MBM1002476.1 transposase zinc-binding domain-containing protein [Desulfofustis sp. PB-SRB1]HBH29803.1 hypothetical protein [Desulfofustis sp.]HBH32513.1 hypothetical protein [Desulfofustis sp.]
MINIKCGDLHEGFARIRCPDCHQNHILAFSCRGRWFFPSCHAKKVAQFRHHLRETVLYPVAHRHYAFSIPNILRRFFVYSKKSPFILNLLGSTVGKGQIS